MIEYLQSNKLTIEKFAKKIGCTFVTIIKAKKGIPISASIASKIRQITKGEVSPSVSNVGRKKGFVVKNPVPHFKHELSHTKEYRIWVRMRRCCYNEKFCQYKSYGAIGVTVCLEWRNDPAKFLEDMGPIPNGYKSLVLAQDAMEFNKDTCTWEYDARGKIRTTQKTRRKPKDKRTHHKTKTTPKNTVKIKQLQFNENMDVEEVLELPVKNKKE